jgi:hypothetical protein
LSLHHLEVALRRQYRDWGAGHQPAGPGARRAIHVLEDRLHVKMVSARFIDNLKFF